MVVVPSPRPPRSFAPQHFTPFRMDKAQLIFTPTVTARLRNGGTVGVGVGVRDGVIVGVGVMVGVAVGATKVASAAYKFTKPLP